MRSVDCAASGTGPDEHRALAIQDRFQRAIEKGRILMSELANETLVTLTADIVSAHAAHNSVSTEDLPRMIGTVFSALSGLGTQPAVEEPATPAVPIRSSVKPDHIVCLEDGKKLKMLKRHLMTHYRMTPADYRAKWGLPADYPMVAPNYAEKRRALAKSIGLGRKPGTKIVPGKKPASKR